MFVLKGGMIWDGLGGSPYRADMLVEQGKIAQIAPDICCDEAQQIDVSDCMVLPGFIDSLNIYGCKGPGWGDNDLAEHSDPVLPQMNSVFAFDQDSMCFQQLYRYGVTASGISPSPANVLAGKAAAFYTYGSHPYRMLIREEVAQVASVTGATKKPYSVQNRMPMTRMGSFSLLREALQKAQSYDPEKGYDPKSDALLPVLAGKVPLIVHCASKAEMEGVLHLIKEFPSVQLVLAQAYGLDAHFEEVASGKVAVMLGDLTDGFNRYNAQVDWKALKALLQQGARIACTCCSDGFASGKESLLWNGILWHKHGIDENQVLQAMTSTPAQLLGIDEITGSLEQGKSADFSVWTANPLTTYQAALKMVCIQGENLLEKGRETSCW